jgi:hypothetical protein
MIRKIVAWMKSMVRWLLEPAPIWIAVLVIVVVVLVCTCLASTPAVGLRYAGLALELAGVATVAIGLRDKWYTFEKPSLKNLVVAWLKRVPRFSPKTTVHVGSGNITLGGLSAQAYGWHGTGPDSPLEQRVDALERNVEAIQGLIVQVRQEIRQEADKLNTKISQEERARLDADRALHVRLEKFGAGGLHLEAIGLFWLVTGLVLGSLPVELARLWQH